MNYLSYWKIEIGFCHREVQKIKAFKSSNETGFF